MKHHLAIRQGADRLTVLADVRNHHDVGQEARIALWEELGRPGKLAELAEIAGDAQEILLGKFLIAKNDDGMIEPGVVDGFDGGRIERPAQIDVTHLGTDMGRQPGNIETGFGRNVHVISSREAATPRQRL